MLLAITAIGAAAAIAAAVCNAPVADRISVSWPPASEATITATLNHSHC